jgi:flavin-dependent dehydrogenase
VKTDVAIVGAGPGGTATALFLAQKGIRSTIIEKAPFPRYHIGESLTGECGNCLRTLGLEQEMNSRRHPVKYGVTVYGPGGKNSFWVPVKGWTPTRGMFEATTWSVPRSDFDAMLLTGAAAQGVQIIPGEAIEPLRDAERVHGVRVRRASGELEDIEAEVLVDASGQTTFLCNHGVTGEKSRGNYDKQVAIFSQVREATRDPGPASGNTLIFYRQKHHWAWFIPLDDEITSVGVVVPCEYFRAKNESKHDFLVRELDELNSELARRLPNRELIEETRAISNYSYHIKEFTGKGYLCVGDSHRFIDPVFSFGVFFSMKEGEYAAAAIEAYLGGAGRDAHNPFAEYQRLCEHGQDVVQDMLDAFWEQPYAFTLVTHKQFTDDIIHIFAGRVYNEKPSEGLLTLRRIIANGRRLRAQTAQETAAGPS